MASRSQGKFSKVPLYAGGLLGPLGTSVVIPMFPELRDSFGVSTEAVGWAFSAYMFPFAAILMFSGTIGERLGRRRTVRTTFVLYAVATAACGLAPNFGVFIAGRALQGAANAFITPLLLAGLAEVSPPERLGKVVGRYSSMQMIGGTAAPLIGGLAADINWRWAMIAIAGVGLLLSTAPPPGEPRASVDRPPIRPLFSLPVLSTGITAMLAAVGPVGAGVFVGLHARDGLDLSATQAGLVLVGGSAAAAAFGPLSGALLDRFGALAVGVVSLVSVSVAVLAIGWTSGPAALVGLWVAGAILANLVAVVFQTLGTEVTPANRGGALSLVLACRFAGHALGPVLWVPLYGVDPRFSFAAMASVGFGAVVAVVVASRSVTAAKLVQPQMATQH